MEAQTHYNGFVLTLRDVWNAVQCYRLIMNVYRTALSLVCTWKIGLEGLKDVEDFKKKYKDRIIQAPELEQKQLDQQWR